MHMSIHTQLQSECGRREDAVTGCSENTTNEYLTDLVCLVNAAGKI